MRRWLWVVAVGLRLLAAGLLVFGPWTDEPDELAGWDSSRFQQIHDAPGQPWVDHEVEYPPGSVVIMELIAGDGVVETQRTLIALSLVIDLGIAALLAKGGPADLIGVKGDAGLAYLLLGLIAVPTGMLRLDLWATAGTAVGLLALGRAAAASSRATRARATVTAGFALAVGVGAAIKIAPGLLIPVAFAARRRAEAIAALGLGAALGGAWLSWAGGDALNQVLSLRGVTGWHLESVPGSLLALFTDDAPRLEADAYRIGTVSDTVVLAGRLVTLAVVVWLGVLVT